MVYEQIWTTAGFEQEYEKGIGLGATRNNIIRFHFLALKARSFKGYIPSAETTQLDNLVPQVHEEHELCILLVAYTSLQAKMIAQHCTTSLFRHISTCSCLSYRIVKRVPAYTMRHETRQDSDWMDSGVHMEKHVAALMYACPPVISWSPTQPGCRQSETDNQEKQFLTVQVL